MKRTALGLIALFLTLPLFAQVQLRLPVPQDTPDKKAERQALFEKFHRFEAANPGVKIVPVDFAYTDRQTFFLKQAAGLAPDTFDVYATEAQMLVSKHWAAPLDDYIAGWDKKAWYNPASFEPFTVEGHVYGIPSANYVNHIIYNKKMFREKGIPEPGLNWTWDEFIRDAVKLTDKSKGIAGYIHMTKGSEGGWALTDFLYAAGGEVETVKDGKAYAAFDSPEAIAAAQLLKDLKWKYDVLPANWLNGWSDVFNVFGDGKAAMVFDGGWGRNLAINGEGMDWHDIGVTLMPKGPGAKGRQAGVMGGSYWIINGLTKDKAVRDAAWKWQTFESWDQSALKALKAQIADARKSKQFRAFFDYKPLLPDAPYIAQEKAVLDANSDVALQWGTPEFLKRLPTTAHPEPAVAAQEAYGKYLSPLVQKLMSDKNADAAALMKDAAARFQKDVLDPANAN
jgi:ABC-type glycerol-3-phosphate transport system substrate-binding protein